MRHANTFILYLYKDIKSHYLIFHCFFCVQIYHEENNIHSILIYTGMNNADANIEWIFYIKII